MGLNTNLLDVGYSHDKTTFFASKKKMPLNEKKCNGLIVNNKIPYAVPVLYVNGIIMELMEKIRYLGDIFNAHGTNTDLLQDRVSRGVSCLISCISECSEVTQGCREIETMLLLYKLLFLSTVLYNSEAWSCLNQNEVSQLERLQQKFLKRVLQVPKSTPNTLVLLELGLLPIASEIHARQLRFLHHILSLPIEDPVRQTYEQQKLFPQEKNWYNEVILLLKLYAIDIEETDVVNMNIDQWKYLVKSSIKKYCLCALNNKRASLSKGSGIRPYQKLETQEYISSMWPNEARILFRLRTETYDIKMFRPYMYDPSKMECRLCGSHTEDVDHVLNECTHIQHKLQDRVDVHSEKLEEQKEVVRRVMQFSDLLNEQSEAKTSVSDTGMVS